MSPGETFLSTRDERPATRRFPMSAARQLKLTQYIPCSRRTRQRWGLVIPTGGLKASGTMPNRPRTVWAALISRLSVRIPLSISSGM